jgi:hypothetical protein
LKKISALIATSLYLNVLIKFAAWNVIKKLIWLAQLKELVWAAIKTYQKNLIGKRYVWNVIKIQKLVISVVVFVIGLAKTLMNLNV